MTPERYHQINELFKAATDRDLKARPEFLAKACAGDGDLQQEVEAMLSADAHSGGFLEQPPSDLAADLLDNATRPQVGLGTMPLSAGTRLGQYEILGPIGKGGMGEVYRAKDTKLKREVAVKVLPEAFANDRERMARFQREAEILASLNHPNIAQIYRIEERALVMELVPGEPLNGPLPLAIALNYAKQIAEALEAAHEKGIIHRDLKPSNIIVTPEGVVKVLDFGLAAVTTQGKSSGAVDATDSNGVMLKTEEGLILGTASYMSPEQATGKAVDRRADIWSFGSVLFEMLSGLKLFRGETVAHTLADVLTKPIDLSRVPEATPRVVRELLRRCLNRDFKMRLSHIAEARILLQEYLANPAEEVAPAPGAYTRGWVVGASALACIAAVAGFGWWKAARPLERPLLRLDVNLGAEYSGGDVILSPDGARLVFVSKGRLFTRRLNQSKATELAGGEGAYGPFFSPDGRWVAFFGGGKLKKISVEGGAVITLCEAPSGRGGAWGEDHSILAALTANRSPLMRIPDSGGTPEAATDLAQDEILHRWPQILPGGKAVLFTASTSPRIGAFDEAKIEVMSFEDRSRKTLQRGTYGRYLPTATGAGHLVYIRKDTLFAVPFSPDTLEVSGTPVPVLQKVSYSANSGSAQFDFSSDGTLVYRSRGESERGMVTLQWLSSGGKLQSLPAQPGVYSQPHFSPDGKLLALTVASETGTDIWLYDWRRDAMSRLTFGDGTFAFPVWSPDGRYLAFRAGSGISWTRADGTGKPQPLTLSKPAYYPWSFSADGKRLAFAETGADDFDLWTVPLENDAGGLRAGKPEVFLQTPENGTYPAYSPDGRWIAYRSIRGGKAEIYVRAFPDTGGKWQISDGESILAIWSPNGRDLFYLTGDQQIMVVSYTTRGNSFVPDKPRLWSEKRLAVTAFQQNLDISPDGKRFVVLMEAEAQRANNQVTFLQNFFDEVRRLVAAGK